MAEPVADQDLIALDFSATTDRHGDNPPTLTVSFDVRHTETGLEWMQNLTFTREKWVAFMRLLDYAAKNEGVKWRRP